MSSSSSKHPRRWIDMSEAEKKEVIRIRSVENCKKNRKKWRENDREMQELYDSNEKRIHELEKVVARFSKELARDSRSSSKSSSKNSKYRGSWQVPSD